jgi:cytochrome c553
MKTLFGLILAALVVPLAQAADIGAEKELATGFAAACNGQNGVSVSDTIPNLAAQRPAYLEARLKMFKDGTQTARSGESSGAHECDCKPAK